MRHYTKKRAKQYRKYSKLRENYLQEHTECEAGLPGCWTQSTQIHHKAGKMGDKLTEVDNFLACCTHCHNILEHEPNLAKERGLSKSRLCQ